MLNVEVVRQRVQRSTVDAPALVPFAEAAAAELGRATELVNALLALARPAHSPVDLAGVLEPLVLLYGAILAPSGGRVTLERARTEVLETSASADLVRCVIASALDQAIDGQVVQCTLASRGSATAVDIRGTGHDVIFEAGVLAAMTHEGIEQAGSPNGIVILFPRDERDRTREAS